MRYHYFRNLAAFLILFLGIFRLVCWLSSIRNEKIRCCSDGICVSGDSECTLCPTRRRPPITAKTSTVQCHCWSQLYLAGLSCIWLTLNEALMHYDTTVGCDLEAPMKGGGMQQLDHMQGHHDRVTHCQPDLNLKVGKKRSHLGTSDPIWAKCSKNGQNFSKSGQKKDYS